MSINLLPLIAPALFVVAGLCAFVGAGMRPRWQLRVAEWAAIGSIAVAIATVAWVTLSGALATHVDIAGKFDVAVKLDAISVSMLLLVSFIGWIVIRYSVNYLDGEARQGPFTGWLCLTLAAVLTLVTAGHLVPFVMAWIATSLILHRLLLFYPERVAARRAARKKFVIARVADGALIGAAVLLMARFGTADMSQILDAARAGAGDAYTSSAAVLLALAAMLKSAQFPTHGWLTEVMETPTPVSALLHAGVINAGGFLLIRFADIMVLSPTTLAGLVMVGGFTALFGGLVMLTQPAVKTSLAWSTVGQMGFMVLECGLGLFGIALLHIVAHSLYKAHSFLVSGAAVDTIAANRRPGLVAVPDAAAVGRAFVVALAIYIGVGLAFGFNHKSPQAIALGAILIFGVAYLIAQGLADSAPRELTRRTTLYSLATSISYFALQSAASFVTRDALPPVPEPGPLQWALIVLAVVSFALVAVVQAMFPLWANHPAAAGLRVHLSNGLYANAIFDRLLGGWSVPLSRAVQRTGTP